MLLSFKDFLKESINDKSLEALAEILLYIHSFGTTTARVESNKRLSKNVDLITHNISNNYKVNINNIDLYRWTDFIEKDIFDDSDELLLNYNQYSYTTLKPKEIIKVFNKNYGIIFKPKFTKGLGIDVNKILIYIKNKPSIFRDMKDKHLLEDLRYNEILDLDNNLSYDMLMTIEDVLDDEEIIVFSPETRLLKKSEIVLNLNI